MLGRHVGRRLGGELVELVGRDAVVDALDDLLRDLDGINMLSVVDMIYIGIAIVIQRLWFAMQARVPTGDEWAPDAGEKEPEGK